LYYERPVEGDMAHEIERRGFGREDGDGGGVEVVVGCYEILMDEYLRDMQILKIEECGRSVRK
jgi:hypothetical protein